MRTTPPARSWPSTGWSSPAHGAQCGRESRTRDPLHDVLGRPSRPNLGGRLCSPHCGVAAVSGQPLAPVVPSSSVPADRQHAGLPRERLTPTADAGTVTVLRVSPGPWRDIHRKLGAVDDHYEQLGRANQRDQPPARPPPHPSGRARDRERRSPLFDGSSRGTPRRPLAKVTADCKRRPTRDPLSAGSELPRRRHRQWPSARGGRRSPITLVGR